MTTETIDRGAAILTGYARHKAGARAMIKHLARKASRNAGFPLGCTGMADWTPAQIAEWALANPGPVLAGCVRAMRSAADAWTEGNNSGDPDKLAECERRCGWLREDAQTVLALWGISCDFPGLYPTYKRGGRTEYENPARLVEGCHR